MRPVLALAALLGTSACAPAPAPVHMAATEASELLERFAAGAASADVCTPQGRALLRGAVRAYGAAMESGGVAWPAIPVMGADADQLRSMDVTVLVAFAAGFVEASDFRGNARRMANALALTQYPEIRNMRAAARGACSEVAALQQAAARFVLETERYREMAERAIGGHREAERLRRQERRMARAEMQMQDLAAAVQARLNAS